MVVSRRTISLAIALFIAYLSFLVWRLNKNLKTLPADVLKLTPHRWTKQNIKEAYERAQEKPTDWRSKLPPRRDRRYIVTGGVGGVGGELVLQLLLRGQDPKSVRVLDIRKPDRGDLLVGPVTEVDFIETDLSSEASTHRAVSKPWPPAVSKLPLTVFHVAAVIDPCRRTAFAYEEIKRVNVDGTRYLLGSTRLAGADIFIYCSSASVALYPLRVGNGLWTGDSREFWQLLQENDIGQPLRPKNQFFGNYGYSKAAAERLVCDANSPAFRTGAIRPANGIYGNSTNDQVVGPCLRKGLVTTWMTDIVQNFVHAGNVGLGHLLFEAALANDDMPECAGRAFQVSDEGPPPTFGDVYQALKAMSETTPIQITHVQPALMLLIAYIVEACDIASHLPVLEWFVPRPKGDIAKLQPGIFTVSSHTPALDTAARRSVETGGLGYSPACTTLEGMAEQVLSWNREHAPVDRLRRQQANLSERLVEKVESMGTAAVNVHG